MATPTVQQLQAKYPGYKTMDPNAVVPDYLKTGGEGKGAPAWALGNPNQPAGSSGTPSSTSSSGAPTVPSYQEAYQTAAGQIGGVDTSGLESTAQDIKTAAANKSAAITASIPSVQNIYQAMADYLKSQKSTDVANVQEKGTKQVASESASAAASGFDTTSGYEASLTRGIQSDIQKEADQTASKYDVQLDQLTNEEAKSVSDLQAEAADALLTGNKDVADITGKIIQLKQNQSQMIAAAATNIQNAANKEEATYYKNLYQDALLDFKSQTLDLQAQKLQLQQSVDTTKLYQQQASGRQQLSSIVQWASTNNKTPDELKTAIQQARSSKDSTLNYLDPTEIDNAVNAYVPPSSSSGGGFNIINWLLGK